MDLYQKEAKETIAFYPDPHVTKLTKRLAEKNDVPIERILVGNGAAELIFLLASCFREKKVRIIEPAFSEYRDACTAYGCEVDSFVLEEPWELHKEQMKQMVKGVDLLFLCSPNNPTGVRYSKEQIVTLLKEADKGNVTVVLDEAFYDFCEEKQGLQQLCHMFPHLIVLRSLTKMYAIAGLRLGYMIANERLIKKVKTFQPPWSVNGLAQSIGFHLLDEESFVTQSVHYLHTERERMRRALEQLDFFISPSTVNFYLLSERNKKDLKPLFLFLLHNGIVPRHTYNFNGLDGCYLRLAVKDRQSNDQLLRLLQNWRLQK